jgi:ribonucleotide monophosphatase NagD (HAD superfamily)
MANEHGFTAVLTLTGETTHGTPYGSSYAPDLVVRDLYELAEHLGLARMEERSE